MNSTEGVGRFDGEFGGAEMPDYRSIDAAGSLGSSAPPSAFPLDIDPDELMEGGEDAGYFDWDGTVFRWQYFHELLVVAVRKGILPSEVIERASASLVAYLDRKGPFSTWVNQQVAAYQDNARLAGVSVAAMRDAAAELYREKGRRVHVFTRELLGASRDVGIHRAIISGTMIEAIEVIANAEGIHAFLGTEHPRDAAGELYTGGKQKEWVLDKAEAMRELARRHHLNISRAFAIGDSLTDAKMFEMVQWPICFNPAHNLLTLARQRRWPVVQEKKDVCLLFRPNASGKLVETTLADILPPKLASAMQIRLEGLGLIDRVL